MDRAGQLDKIAKERVGRLDTTRTGDRDTAQAIVRHRLEHARGIWAARLAA